MFNIILADDHKLVRKGLKALLCTEPDFRVVAEAENGQEALELVDKLKPEILILDLMMPVLSGLEVTRALCRKPCSTRIIILSMHSNEAYVIEALRLGAYGYILKESSPEELFKGIRQVGGGRRFLGAPLTLKTVDEFAPVLEMSLSNESLTKREEEILQMASRGLSNQEIADKLGISSRTVETHRNNLMHKLNLHSQIELTNMAIQLGLLSLSDTSQGP
jgi:DNA-binding NarL/FixJ family response regulator